MADNASPQRAANPGVNPAGSTRDTSRAAETGAGEEVRVDLLLRVGARPLPDYELIQMLGAGGYGEVWKARGPGGIPMAMKFIRRDVKANAVEERALEIMRNVRHPHLVGLFGAWHHSGFMMIAMELADGTLMQRLQEAQKQGLPGIPRDELLRYFREAASAIDHLNGQGIQHRDLKPPNLLLVGGGVKVADFGLAKVIEGHLASNTGHLTPAYAAPEFFRGQTSDRSDQYSLAVSYCQLRGGRLPFHGGMAQLMIGHVMHPPDLTMLPDAERPVVGRALAKKPEERWPSCLEFVEALTGSTSRAVQTVTPPAPPPEPVPASPPAGSRARVLVPEPPPPPEPVARSKTRSGFRFSRAQKILIAGTLFLALLTLFVFLLWLGMRAGSGG